MRYRFLYASVSVVTAFGLEMLFPQQKRPELAFGLCLYFTFLLPSEEALYLCLLGGILKDSLSVERFGLFTLLGAAFFISAKFISSFFRPNVPLLAVSYCASIVLLRSLYALHISIGGYLPNALFGLELISSVVSALIILIPLYSILLLYQHEYRRRRLYAEKDIG